MTQQEFQNRFIYNPSTDRLGKGGFGEVFKAYDTYRDRWVAVKMAKVETDHESVRLSKEVDMVNKLPAHPNIAYYEECYTFSSFAGEYDFGILQYYEAGNLQQLIDNNNLTFAQKQNLLTQLLEGIGFLHGQGIIHRDLKPANILIVKRGEEYIPKITDFGISKKLDVNKSSIFGNSLAGAGTLSFASPEQLGGTTIRKNTDLWSFGVIAYWLLAGELPFNTGIHGTTSEAGRAELFTQIARGVLPQGITAINQPWRKLIVACLETDSEKRVRNVEECKGILTGTSNSVSDKTQLITDSYEQHSSASNASYSTQPQPEKTKTEKVPVKSNKTRTVVLISVYVLSVIFALVACFVGENNHYTDYDNPGYETDSVLVDTVAVSPIFTATINETFQVDLPFEMILMNETKPEDADIMYGSDKVYFISITESVSEVENYGIKSLEDYGKLLPMAIKQAFPNADISSLSESNLNNGDLGYQLDFTAKSDGVEIYGIKSVVKLGKNYHQLFTWCLTEDKDTYSYTMQEIHKSVRAF